MATIDYNSGNVSVYFFPSNISKPVWFCDSNTGGIQIATGGATPISNTIQIGNSSSTLKLSGVVDFSTEIQVGPLNGAVTTINPGALVLSEDGAETTITPKTLNISSDGAETEIKSDSLVISAGGDSTTIRIAEVRVSEQTGECWMTPADINISSDTNKITIKENSIHSSGLLLDVQGGILNVSGSGINASFAGGFNSKYLIIQMNGQSYKIALHDMQ
jgi:hypothetical protein